MKIIKMFVKSAAYLVCVAIAYLFIVMRFGTKEYTLQCNGELKYKDGARLANNRLVIKVERYRPVLFLATNDGDIFIEGDIFVNNYSFKYNGGYLYFYEPGSDENNIAGSYRLLTDKVFVRNIFGEYHGSCTSYKTGLPSGDFE